MDSQARLVRRGNHGIPQVEESLHGGDDGDEDPRRGQSPRAIMGLGFCIVLALIALIGIGTSSDHPGPEAFENAVKPVVQRAKSSLEAPARKTMASFRGRSGNTGDAMRHMMHAHQSRPRPEDRINSDIERREIMSNQDVLTDGQDTGNLDDKGDWHDPLETEGGIIQGSDEARETKSTTRDARILNKAGRVDVTGDEGGSGEVQEDAELAKDEDAVSEKDSGKDDEEVKENEKDDEQHDEKNRDETDHNDDHDDANREEEENGDHDDANHEEEENGEKNDDADDGEKDDEQNEDEESDKDIDDDKDGDKEVQDKDPDIGGADKVPDAHGAEEIALKSERGQDSKIAEEEIPSDDGHTGGGENGLPAEIPAKDQDQLISSREAVTEAAMPVPEVVSHPSDNPSSNPEPPAAEPVPKIASGSLRGAAMPKTPEVVSRSSDSGLGSPVGGSVPELVSGSPRGVTEPETLKVSQVAL